LGLLLGLDAIVAVAVAVSDGDADSAVSAGPVALGVLHPATSAARTTHELRTCRR
jgi:hypothetical protein